MTREELEDFKKIKKFVQIKLKEINYEGLGEQDAQEFGKDFDEVMTLAEKALSAEPCEDCISRQAVIDALQPYIDANKDSDDLYLSGCGDGAYHALHTIKTFPSVNPTRPKGDFRKIWDRI